MELQRFNYRKMLEWKSNRDKSSLDGLPRTTVLQLEGPRGSGKTYLAKKFGAECYKHTVYWDVSDLENNKVLENFTSNIGNLVRKDSWALLFSIYDPENFVDSPDTLVIIDEIQDSTYFFNSIRKLREFKFHVLASVSYPGLIRRKKFFYPGNDATRVLIPTLTFREFLFNLGKLEIYNSLDLTGKSPLSHYGKIQEYWDDYMTVGGYPNLVLTYMDFRDAFAPGNHSQVISLPENSKVIWEKHKEIEEVIRLDCKHYMDEVEQAAFDDLCLQTPNYWVSEKVGKNIDFSAYLNDKTFDYERTLPPLVWMKNNHILSPVDRAQECNLNKLALSSRYYYTDVGLANYCFHKYIPEKDMSNAKGLLDKNYVFLELNTAEYDPGPYDRRPVFGTYQDGEIDFLVFSFATNCTYAIDVNTGQSPSKTANKLLSDRIVDFVLCARSGYHGGIGSPGILTIPIYLIGRFDFDSMINPPLLPSLRRQGILESVLDEDDDEDDDYILP